MKAKVSPYSTQRAFALIDELTGGAEECRLNTFYQCAANPRLFWYCNARGYYHICRCSAVRFMGSVAWYEIADDIITGNGDIKPCRTIGKYASREKCMRVLRGEIVGLIA